jgi:hypothetical protein
MPLNAQVAVSIVAHETAAGDLSRAMRVTPATYAMLFTDGTAANQAQVVWSAVRVCAGNDTIQLSSLPDTRDGAAVTVSFTAVKALYVRNTHATNLLGLSTSLNNSIGVVPGGVFLVVNPSNTGATSNIGAAVNHFITATAGTTYEIVIIGEGTVT